jgi:hypothetical protein
VPHENKKNEKEKEKELVILRRQKRTGSEKKYAW